MHLHTHERTLCIYTNVKVPRDLTEGLGGENPGGQRGFIGSFQSKPILWYVAHTSFLCPTEDRTFRIKDLVSRVALTYGSPARVAERHWNDQGDPEF